MKLLWFTWKDRQHPHAGGAEVVNEELAKRLAADGHEVIFVVAGFKRVKGMGDGVEGQGDRMEGVGDGVLGRHEPFTPYNPNPYTLIRLGNHYSVYWLAYRYYKKHLVGWADLVIDEMNTVPFFAKYYVKEPNILFVHMLCRQIWFYQIFFPLNIIGYLLEPLYLWILRNQKVITISESTKRALIKHGFNEDKINLFNVGIEIESLPSLHPKHSAPKYDNPTLLSLGSVRAMKRTVDQLKAFEIAKHEIKNLKLKIAGDASSTYGQKVLKLINNSHFADDIEYLGKVTKAQKITLMQKCHLIMVTSIKEGWGLIVTEAASQGTPAVVYDVDGLRDSVQHNHTGLVCSYNTASNLARSIMVLLGDSQDHYNQLRENAWHWSKETTFERSYHNFKEVIGKPC